jgi:hypothetical protein
MAEPAPEERSDRFVLTVTRLADPGLERQPRARAQRQQVVSEKTLPRRRQAEDGW